MRSDTFTWKGGQHEFALPIGLVIALEEKCGAGIGVIYARLDSSMFSVSDAIYGVALGLEGGGMAKQDALKLVYSVAEDWGLDGLATLAADVIGRALKGYEPEGEAGAESPSKNSPSTQNKSSDQPGQSD